MPHTCHHSTRSVCKLNTVPAHFARGIQLSSMRLKQEKNHNNEDNCRKYTTCEIENLKRQKKVKEIFYINRPYKADSNSKISNVCLSIFHPKQKGSLTVLFLGISLILLGSCPFTKIKRLCMNIKSDSAKNNKLVTYDEKQKIDQHIVELAALFIINGSILLIFGILWYLSLAFNLVENRKYEQHIYKQRKEQNSWNLLSIMQTNKLKSFSSDQIQLTESLASSTPNIRYIQDNLLVESLRVGIKSVQNLEQRLLYNGDYNIKEDERPIVKNDKISQNIMIKNENIRRNLFRINSSSTSKINMSHAFSLPSLRKPINTARIKKVQWTSVKEDLDSSSYNKPKYLPYPI